MSTAVPPYATPSFASLKSGSIGLKFFFIFFLAVFMSIPALFVDGLVDERAVTHNAITRYEANGTPIPPSTVAGIKLADSYRSLHRSLKYITLFLGLVFLTYFVFEVTTAKRVHPGQYALVGVAQTIFYLLLLSLAEIVGFDYAFLIAGLATVLLFSINTQWVFVSCKLGLRALAVFSMLYAFIYVLLRLENYALLVGAVASFAAVSATMYFTRGLDWYSATRTATPAPAGGVRESWLK